MKKSFSLKVAIVSSGISVMSQGTSFKKRSVLVAWSLLAFCSSSRLMISEATLSNDTDSPSSDNELQLTAPFPLLQKQPPFCVYPPPTTPKPPSSLPPPPSAKPEHAVWCVAKPTVPAQLLQTAMDYACSSGGDCSSIQIKGSCYQPATVLAHASYALNSYWQNMKRAGGSCDFGGVAMLVTVDPSYEQCHFIYRT